MNAMKPGQGTIGSVNGLNMMDPEHGPNVAGTGAARSRATGMGHDDDGFRRERVYLDDTGAGTETRLVVGQAIEIRLPIDPATGQTTAHTGKSSPEMRRDSGPERKVINGQTYDVWVFVAVVGGHATISLAYELPGQILRELM